MAFPSGSSGRFEAARRSGVQVSAPDGLAEARRDVAWLLVRAFLAEASALLLDGARVTRLHELMLRDAAPCTGSASHSVSLRTRGAPRDARDADLPAGARATVGTIGMAALLARVAALEEPGPAAAEETGAQVFRREGEFWTIAYADRVIRLRDVRGLRYLETLLRNPGREFHATELVGDGDGAAAAAPGRHEALRVVVGLGDAGESLDGRARAAYRRRLAELAEEVTDAERCNDLGWLERARDEREVLVAELEAAARGRRAASHAERARIAVTKAIKSVLEKISASHPPLAAHLAATVRRGYFCAYLPDPRHPIEWMG